MRHLLLVMGLPSVILFACQAVPPSANSIVPALTQKVADALAPHMIFTRDGICSSIPQQRIAYNTRGLPPALADLLAQPDAAFLSLQQLEAIATAGIEIAEGNDGAARDIPSQVTFVAEQDDVFLVNIRQRYCRYGSHDNPPWAILIFDRKGNFWNIESGWIDSSTLRWLEDRWVYLADTGRTGQTNWAFGHAARTEDGWDGLTFQDIPHAPNLVWFGGQPDLAFADSEPKVQV